MALARRTPRGWSRALTEIATALREANVPIKGDLQVGFAGGGMPVSLPYRRNYGMSDGVYHMLTRGVAPDFAVIMKPWWAVFAEEPGMCWFKVSVRGTMGYAGITRGTPGYRSSIIPALRVIEEIEAWLPQYTARNTSGTVLPEGHIAALRAGWPERPAFPSATTEFIRRAMQSAHLAGRGQGAVCRGDALNPRAPSGDRVRLGDVRGRSGRRHRPAELDRAIELSRMGTRRGTPAWQRAEDGRADRRRAHPPPRHPVRESVIRGRLPAARTSSRKAWAGWVSPASMTSSNLPGPSCTS